MKMSRLKLPSFPTRGGNTIFTKFLKLESEKQKRILNAAMKEFAQKGYKNASTEVIVKEADISKGALFYYFKNKKELFLYLYDYALEVVKNEILTKFDTKERDIFARRRQALVLKTEVLNKHPEIYDFLGAAYIEEASEVKSELDVRNRGAMAAGKAKLYEGIDTSMFKEGIDIEKAIEIISWTIEGITNKEMQRIKNLPMQEVNFTELLEEVDEYLEILKESFYK